MSTGIYNIKPLTYCIKTVVNKTDWTWWHSSTVKGTTSERWVPSSQFSGTCSMVPVALNTLCMQENKIFNLFGWYLLKDCFYFCSCSTAPPVRSKCCFPSQQKANWVRTVFLYVTEQWQNVANILKSTWCRYDSELKRYMPSFGSKRTTPIRFNKELRTGLRFDRHPALCSIIFQSTKFHARCLCKAPSWETRRNAEGERLRERGRGRNTGGQRNREMRSQPSFSSVCWMSVFHDSLSPLHLSRVHMGTDSISEYVCTWAYFAMSFIFPDEWNWIIHWGWHS